MAQIPDPLNWQTIEDTIYDWFTEQSGVSVVWGNQDSPEEPYPFGVLSVISGPLMVAPQDEVKWTTDLSKPLGQEVALNIEGLRELVVSCQIFAEPPTSLDPSAHPRFIMSRVQASLSAPSVLEAFRNANMSIIRAGDIIILDAPDDDTWIARANMDVRFYLMSQSVEESGFMNEIEITSTPFGIDKKTLP
jgi:hypothetical protein